MFRFFSFLPTKSLAIRHPLSLCPKHLLQDITTTTMASIQVGNIDGSFLDFGCSIGRTTRATASFHHLVIRNIIAHVEDFLVLQTMFFLQGFVFPDLD